MVQIGSGTARKAREQVASHVSAGQSGSGSVNGFESAERIITNNLGKPRTIPDVHLTRFAAYFVALNADQSKPDSAARDTPMRGCIEQRLSAVDYNDFLVAG